MTRLGNLFLYSCQYTVIYLLIFVSINFCFRNVVFSVSSRLVFAARGEVYQPRQVWLRHPQDHAQEFVGKNFGKFGDSIAPGTAEADAAADLLLGEGEPVGEVGEEWRLGLMK